MALLRILPAWLSVVALVLCEPPVHYQPSGYRYDPPSATFLPPKTGLALPSTYLPPNSFAPPQPAGGGAHHPHHHHHDGHDNEVPKGYEFGYAVHDARSGTRHDRRERADARGVRGRYRVRLPDGRTQIVTYHADWRTGFHADVRYEGQALFPDHRHGYNYDAPQTPAAYGPPGYQ